MHGRGLLLGIDLVTDRDRKTPASDAMFAELTSRFGRLDLLFNNAGIFPRHQAIDAIALADLRHAVDTNLTGMFFCLQHAFR